MQWRTQKLLFSALVAGLCWSANAPGQDAVSVDPKHHKVEFDNDHVRVLRITFGPGEQAQMHSHPCAIAVGVTDGPLLFHFPDGGTRPANLKAGQVIVAKPTTHMPENKTTKPVEVILVELKDGGC